MVLYGIVADEQPRSSTVVDTWGWVSFPPFQWLLDRYGQRANQLFPVQKAALGADIEQGSPVTTKKVGVYEVLARRVPNS